MSQKLLFQGQSILRGSIQAAPHYRISEQLVITALLSSGMCTIHPLAEWVDSHPLLEVLYFLGAGVSFEGGGCVIDGSEIISGALPTNIELTTEQHQVLFFTLLVKFHSAAIVIDGNEPLVQEIKWLASTYPGLQLQLEEDQGYLVGELGVFEKTTRQFQLPFENPDHTEQLILLSCINKGIVTTIKNPSQAPRTLALVTFLQSMGAEIEFSADQLVVTGVENLQDGVAFVPHDTYEVCMFTAAAALCKGDIEIRNIEGQSILSFLHKLRQAGLEYKLDSDSIYVWGSGKELLPIEVKTGFYPDVEPKWAGLLSIVMSQLVGESTVVERVRPQGIAGESVLATAGLTMSEDLSSQEGFFDESLRVDQFGPRALRIFGPTKIQGGVYVLDHSADSLLPVLIGLISQDEVTIENAVVLAQQYPRCLMHLQQLGAKVKVLND